MGVVAEVLFPNGIPFQENPFDDFAEERDRELLVEGRQAYNRWLVDFCAEMPERRKGQMSMDFRTSTRPSGTSTGRRSTGSAASACPG